MSTIELHKVADLREEDRFERIGKQWRNESQRTLTQAIIADRVLKNHKLSDIATDLKLSYQQVLKDLQIVEAQWRASALVDFDEARGIELAKLAAVEREYWDAWERSKRPKTSSTQRTSPARRGFEEDVRVNVGLRTEERDGDPRFLDGVFRCIERRIKLYGLDEAERVSISGVLDVSDPDNALIKRLDRYRDALAGTLNHDPPAIAAGNSAGQPVDSE